MISIRLVSRSSKSRRSGFWAGPACLNRRADAAAGTEDSVDYGPDGVGGFDDVFEHLVDDVFLKDAEVAVTEEVLLERLQFEAAFARHVADGEHAEVGEAGFGAHGGEFGVVNDDFVAGKLVFPCFDGGESEVEAGLGVVVSVAGF